MSDDFDFELEYVTPLEFLTEVFNCNDLPLPTRMRAATAAAPFVHPKLASVIHYDGGSHGEKLNHARRMFIAKQVVTGQRKLVDLRPADRPSAADLEEARKAKPWVSNGSPMDEKIARANARVTEMKRQIKSMPKPVLDLVVNKTESETDPQPDPPRGLKRRI